MSSSKKPGNFFGACSSIGIAMLVKLPVSSTYAHMRW
jgi:hypothetical protein